MAILKFDINTPMYVDVQPRQLHLECNDDLATITAEGYLNQFSQYLLPTDMIAVTYENNQSGWFKVVIENNTVTLDASSGGVITPVEDGNFAIFDGTSGIIKDAGYAPSAPTANSIVMTNTGVTVGRVPLFADTEGSLAETSIAAANVLTSSLDEPDVNQNRVFFQTAIVAGILNTGPVVVLPGTPGKAYMIKTIAWSGASGIDFQTGNKNIEFTDGSNIWTAVTTTSLTALENANWGDQTNVLPLPTGCGLSQSTALGQPLVVQYQGSGGTDYTLGVVTVVIEAIRIV